MKIDHLAIWADDIESLREFYTKYFGFVSGEKYHNPRKNFSSYFLSAEEGGARIELMNIPSMADRHKGADMIGLAHFAISVGRQRECGHAHGDAEKGRIHRSWRTEDDRRRML